jgi:hypothetical protein
MGRRDDRSRNGRVGLRKRGRCDVLPPTCEVHHELSFLKRTSCLDDVGASARDRAEVGRRDYCRRPLRIITPSRIRLYRKKIAVESRDPAAKEAHGILRAAILNVRGLAPCAVEPASSAALDPALFRRGLVTHWGLSTFPGSGVFVARKPRLTRILTDHTRHGDFVNAKMAGVLLLAFRRLASAWPSEQIVRRYRRSHLTISAPSDGNVRKTFQ